MFECTVNTTVHATNSAPIVHATTSRHRPPEREPRQQHEHGAESESEVLDHRISVAALPDERKRIPSR